MSRSFMAGVLAVMFAVGLASARAERHSGGETKRLITQCAVKVRGMTCGSCARVAEARMLKIPGVKSAKVDFKSAEAGVEYDSKLTTPEKIVASFNESGGFRAELSKGRKQ